MARNSSSFAKATEDRAAGICDVPYTKIPGYYRKVPEGTHYLKVSRL